MAMPLLCIFQSIIENFLASLTAIHYIEISEKALFQRPDGFPKLWNAVVVEWYGWLFSIAENEVYMLCWAL